MPGTMGMTAELSWIFIESTSQSVIDVHRFQIAFAAIAILSSGAGTMGGARRDDFE